MTETTESPEPEDTPAEAAEAQPERPADQSADGSAAGSAARSAVMLLGSGELSRELAWAFQRLGREVIAVDRYANAPAHGVADRSAVVKMNDAEALTAIIDRADPLYVVAESGGIAVDALIAAAERGLEVFPSPRSVRMTQDREGLRRLAADELGLPTAPFWFAGSVEELTAVAEHAGFPLVVKPVAGMRGEGQSVLLRLEDVEPAWQRAIAAGRTPQNRVLAETVVEVDYEITLLTVRTTGPTGPALHFCEPIGHREGDGDVLEAWQPQQMTPAALDVAKSIAARIVNALGGRGVFGVELLVRGDEVYFSDVRTRPQDTGLVTLRSQRLSEFELHARAILGMHVDTIMISPGAAEVTYAGADSVPTEIAPGNVTAALADALAVAESDVRLFNRPDESDPRRRLGLALATAPDVVTARDRVRRVTGVLRKLW
ncbi:formate-dependent phosphoribosylglycinamide formyltransferase [Mycolicibacterium agri]|uniref:Formate-dependent phosphoribosylglycinamide formyltransferase n=1 Tax=Mycolicibacterium agri TaxID=36811 RepID=A0A2A7MRU7_MYCAG|nr:formate-dependent phosphoribosylglycinamide formyltransferase [Mycolicibacterium agri]PEG33848.1 formate-dependent phosphoribosylglycinamide formyltransferase [Mycolicibacterium agri]GFG52832.1 phosphoribosylglycinamide formyltransferase 2 [Mycolicibacterium agri]